MSYKPPKEIRSALLHEKFGEHSTLIIVDEYSQIHTLTGNDDTFHFLLRDANLPNFKHRRTSGDSTYEATNRGYNGYYDARDALNLIARYRQREIKNPFARDDSPVELWCERKDDFTDCTDYEDRHVYASDYPWLEVGKIYRGSHWRYDHSIPKGCYRVKCEDGEEREAPDSYFRVLRELPVAPENAA